MPNYSLGQIVHAYAPLISGVDPPLPWSDYLSHLVWLDVAPMNAPDTPSPRFEYLSGGLALEAKIYAMQELQRELALLHARLQYIHMLLKLKVGLI
jgi:hypothetical protein